MSAKKADIKKQLQISSYDIEPGFHYTSLRESFPGALRVDKDWVN